MSKNGRLTSADRSGIAGKFAFVVPVVHPKGNKVSDYSVVERALKETLGSYTRQDAQNVVVIVVCHRIPAWADEFRGRVRFIRIGPHPRFEANANDVQIDKGMKYALGSVLAISVEKASFVMLADGDDFVRADLARYIFSRDLGDHDGFVIRQGFNALINVTQDRFRIVQLFRMQDFDRTCGTCRIFSRTALARELERLDPDILTWGDKLTLSEDGLEISPDSTVLDHLWKITEPVTNELYGIIRILGRHDRYGRVFDLLPLSEPLAGKACGHGNHDGPERGGVRWSGVRGCASGTEFVERFGLTGGTIEVGGVEPGLWLRGTAVGAFNRVRKLLNIDFSYERKHAMGLKPVK